MDLPPDIDIRWADEVERSEESQLSLLSAAERMRFQGIRHPRTRQHFLLGRVALRSLLAERLSMQAAAVPLVVAPDGGVDVATSPVRVSIAHSGQRAVAVAALRTIGVDLEQIRPRSEDVSDYILHASERYDYEALTLDPTRRLILYWTLKEAVFKALRTGLRRSPKTIRLAINVSFGAGLAFLDDRAPFELRFQEHDGFYASVAFER